MALMSPAERRLSMVRSICASRATATAALTVLIGRRDRGQFVPSRCVSAALQLKGESSPWPEFSWIPAYLCDLSKG